MRGALGAGRVRIVRQLLTESLVLSSLGAAFGLAFAFILLTWLAHQGAIALPLLSQLQIDGAALGWTLLIAASSAVLFGLVPGLRVAAGNLNEALKDSGSGSGQSRKHERLRSVLVVSEVALACVLLVGAGLLLRSFLHVVDIDLGFQPDHAAAVNVDYDDNPADGNGNTPDSRKAILARRAVFSQQVLQRISAIPGIHAAGISDFLPLGQNRSWGLPFPKGIRPPEKRPPGPLVYVVSPGYLGAMGIRMHGRDFTWNDRSDTETVVVINESYARYLASYAHWPNNDAVGQVVSSGRDMRIVAVAEDVHAESVEGENGWQIYYPSTQTFAESPKLVIRTTLPPADLATSVLTALRQLNPKQTAAEFMPLQSFVDHANSPRRFFMLLVISFAALGLLLAALGIYGVISYSVTRQTQEIGIRMALGASAAHVRRRVLTSTLRLATIGVVIGAAVSLGTARLISSLLYATSPWDATTYYATAIALLAVALIAGYLPARRASRISPLIALRAE
jgi:predicted permease